MLRSFVTASLIFSISIFLFTGCASQTDTKEVAIEHSIPPSTAYYFGNVIYKSGDGKQTLGQTVSLVKRTLNPATAEITEVVIQPQKRFKKPTTEMTTTLKRREGTNIFDATDAEKTFSGKVVYSGDVWAWNKWTYEVDINKDGQRLQGSGGLEPEGLHTEKSLMDKMGVVTVQIKEDLKTIDEATYVAKRAELMKK